jgi:hypothetical protein
VQLLTATAKRVLPGLIGAGYITVGGDRHREIGSVHPKADRRRRSNSPVQWAVEDQTVALVVIDHRAALVRIVIGRPHDPAAAGLDGLGRGVDVRGLDADDDLAGDGVVDRGCQRERDRPAV